MKKLLLILLLSTGLYASQEENHDDISSFEETAKGPHYNYSDNNNTDDYAHSKAINSDDQKKRLAHENSDNEFDYKPQQTNKRVKDSETIFRTEDEDIEDFFKALEYQTQENESKKTDNHISLPPNTTATKTTSSLDLQPATDSINHKTAVKNQYKKCSYSADLPSALTIHMYTHTGEKPYQCRECNKAFTQNSHLKRHMQTHTGEKPYQCPECNKAFAQTTNLKQHIQTHTGEKPYKCTHCNYSCIRSSDLKKHTRIHTGEKPYKCTHIGCNYDTNRSDALKIHIQNHCFKNTYTKP